MITPCPVFAMLITIFVSLILPTNEVDPNCIKFKESVCTACSNGFQLYIGWCWTRDSNCQTLSESGCALCKPGFQLIQGWCYTPDPNCQTLSNGICTLCNSNYMFSNGWCKPKDSNCANLSSSVCSACVIDYYLDDGSCLADGKQNYCLTLTINGCIDCASNDYYQFAKDQCFIRNSNCQIYSDNNCTACISGFQLAAGLCTPLDSQCNGSNGSVCISCVNGYYLNQDFCWQPTNCQTLGNDGCSLCNPGYFAFNGLCQTPIPNCEILSPNGCKACIFGYYLTYGSCYTLCAKHNSKGVCTACYLNYNLTGDLCVPSNSTTACLYFSSKGFCYSCLNSYTLYDGQCYTSITNCEIYSATTGGCLVCQPGYTGNGSACTGCNSITQQSDGNCLTMGGGITAINFDKTFIPCGAGCLLCNYAVSISSLVNCLTPKRGYYLAAGVATKCLSQTCLTCIAGTTTCKSCFYGYTLIAGSCIACSDPNAVYCLPTNTNYSIVCYPNYAVNNKSSEKICQPCATYCLKCDVNGPGNCDSSQCFIGYVQLIGTQNCTVCIDSCSTCDPNNPNTCLKCGPSRYINQQNYCLPCQSRCLACISATSCSICQQGYSLVNSNCYSTLAYPCAIMDSAQKCNQCFQGYTLNGSTCIFSNDYSVNQTYCPYGYYLNSNYSCVACSLPHCQTCSSSSLCTLCTKGYYLSSSDCSFCLSGCSDCSSAAYCSQAADGYYLQYNADGSNSGKVSLCSSPCSTCVYNPYYCLSCINGYDIYLSTCISQSTFIIRIVLGPDQSNTSPTIFSSSDSTNSQLSLSIKSLNRLTNSFCYILQGSLLVNDSTCKNVFRVKSLTSGSVIFKVQVDKNMLKDVDAIYNSICSTLSLKGLDGASVLQATILGILTQIASSLSQSKLALILGVVIGLVILVTIVLVIIVILKRRRQHDIPRQIIVIESIIIQGEGSIPQSGSNLKEGSNQQIIGHSPCLTPMPSEQRPNEIESDDKTEGNDYELGNTLGQLYQIKPEDSKKKRKHIGTKRIQKIGPNSDI